MGFRFLWPILLGFVALACHNSGIRMAPGDASADRISMLSPDAETTREETDALLSTDTTDSLAEADRPPGRDSLIEDAAATDAQRDSLRDQLTVDLFSADGASLDISPALSPDVGAVKATATDALRESQPDMLSGILSDVGGSGSGDALTVPKDVTVYAAKDYGSADSQCQAAASGWLNVVATFLMDDQKCWADSDCTYVSFSDDCGTICVLPMNQQRIGEFGSHVYSYASANCSTCPKQVSYPSCGAPAPVYCNAGRCEYRRN